MGFRVFETLSTSRPLRREKKRKEKKETIVLTERILAIKKAEYVQGHYNLKDMVKIKRTFLTYFEELTDEKRLHDSSNNYDNWFSTLQHLNKIISKNLTFDKVGEELIKKVCHYFDHVA